MLLELAQRSAPRLQGFGVHLPTVLQITPVPLQLSFHFFHFASYMLLPIFPTATLCTQIRSVNPNRSDEEMQCAYRQRTC